MNDANTKFNFRPVTNADVILIHQWLKLDYISEWIHGQGLLNTLNGLNNFLQYRKESKDVNDITNHWIGFNNKKPFVYLLTSSISKISENPYTIFSETDGPFITLDIFIGEKTYLGKGFAKHVIKDFLLQLFPSVSEVFIDPEKTNERAVHVYQKVGFKIVGEFIAPWHPVPHHIMKLNMKDIL